MVIPSARGALIRTNDAIVPIKGTSESTVVPKEDTTAAISIITKSVPILPLFISELHRMKKLKSKHYLKAILIYGVHSRFNFL